MQSANRISRVHDEDYDEPPEGPPATQWQDLQKGIQVVRYAAAPVAQFATMDGTPLTSVTLESHIRAYEQMRLEAGVNTNSPLEQLMFDGAMLAHVQAARLITAASKQSPQVAEIYLKASSRFLAESRKQALALREYRSPIVAKQVTVVQQQNIAGSHQQIGCVVAQTTPTAALSDSELKLLTAQSTDTFVPTAMIPHTVEAQVDDLLNEFLQAPEVKETLAVMDAAWGHAPQFVTATALILNDVVESAPIGSNTAKAGIADDHLPIPRDSRKKRTHGRAQPCYPR